MRESAAADIVEELRQDHRILKQMLDQFPSVDPLDRSEWFDELREILVRHEAAEDQVVYPVLRGQTASEERMLQHRAAEQARAHDRIARLETVTTGSAEFREELLTLRSEVLDHARLEEESILRLIERDWSQEERRQMGRRYSRAKRGVRATQLSPVSVPTPGD